MYILVQFFLKHWFGVKQIWVQIPLLPFIDYANLGKLLNVSLCFIAENGDNKAQGELSALFVQIFT